MENVEEKASTSQKEHLQASQIHIGNLPHGITTSLLEELFALCGNSFKTSIVKYLDHGPRGERAYGYLHFEDIETRERDMEKALFFNASAYEGLLLNISRADSREYGTFFGGIDKSIQIKDMQSKLGRIFGSRVNLNFHVDDKQEKRAIFVNFYDDNARFRYLKMKRLFGSNYRPQLKEYKKMIASDPPVEGKFPIYVRNVPSTLSVESLEKIFALCGPICEVTITDSENSFTKAVVTFTTRRGFDYSLCFDNVPVKNWPLPIRIFSEEDGFNQWLEYPHVIRIWNYEKEIPLAQIEQTLGPIGTVLAFREIQFGNSPTLLAGFRELEQMIETLLLSGKVSLGGKGNAVFQKVELS